MWKPGRFFTRAVLATALLIAVAPTVSFAQHGHGGGGGRGGGWGIGVGGWGGGYYPYYGGGGYGYAPYSYYDYAPNYSNYAPPVPYYQDFPVTGYQSNYPPSFPADNSAMVEIRVPANAQVWFDGQQTQQTGANRFFNTPPLQKNGTYEVRATWNDNGTPRTETKEVQVQPGQRSTVDFMGGPTNPVPKGTDPTGK
jgi:uncharacterized protein (TIGR03000 family)